NGSAPSSVAKRSTGQQKTGEDEGIAIHNPLQPGHIGAQLLLDIDQGHIDDRDIENCHEVAKTERQQRHHHLGSWLLGTCLLRWCRNHSLLARTSMAMLTAVIALG